jgi:undecaprenyl phosphate-alpha-L-ara4N flippase subunit ArnE
VKTPLSSILLVLFASFLGSFGAVFLKAGASRLHRQVASLVFNWRLAFGVGMFLFSFIFYFLGIRDGELSVLYPMVSLGYLWTLVWSRLFFGEPTTPRKLAGVGLIICGIVVLNLGNR